MRVRRSVAALGAALAVVALAGCAQGPGVVAEVNDRTFTTADVERVSTELGPFLNDASPSAVVTALVQAETGPVLAERFGVDVSDDDARAELDKLAGQAGIAPAEWGEGSLAIARLQLIGQELTTVAAGADAQAEFSAALASLDVTVNPRYGEYDPTTGAVSRLQPDWIVAPPAE